MFSLWTNVRLDKWKSAEQEKKDLVTSIARGHAGQAGHTHALYKFL